MEKLSTTSTVVGKIALIFLFVTIFCVLYYLSEETGFWQLKIFAFILLVPLGSVFYNFHFRVKTVLLDELDRSFIVKHYGKNIRIDFEDVKKIRMVKIVTIMYVIELNKEFEFGTEVVFEPKYETFVFDNRLEKRLNKLIKS